MLRSALSMIASKIKGVPYEIDSKIPISALFYVVRDRAISMLRCLIRGVVISTNPARLVMLGKGVKLRNRRCINFGRGVSLGDAVSIDGLSSNGINLGDGSTIGSYGIIRATGVLNNIGVGLRIGARSSFDSFCFFGASGGIEVGNDVIGGQRVSFHAESHNFSSTEELIKNQGITRKGICVEDNCWIGSGVIFLDGTHVSSGCVVGAGSVVRGFFPKNSVIAGIPARVIKSREVHSPIILVTTESQAAAPSQASSSS